MWAGPRWADVRCQSSWQDSEPHGCQWVSGPGWELQRWEGALWPELCEALGRGELGPGI